MSSRALSAISAHCVERARTARAGIDGGVELAAEHALAKRRGEIARRTSPVSAAFRSPPTRPDDHDRRGRRRDTRCWSPTRHNQPRALEHRRRDPVPQARGDDESRRAGRAYIQRQSRLERIGGGDATPGARSRDDVSNPVVLGAQLGVLGFEPAAPLRKIDTAPPSASMTCACRRQVARNPSRSKRALTRSAVKGKAPSQPAPYRASTPRQARSHPRGKRIARIVARHAGSRGPARRPALTAHAARYLLHAPHGRRRRRRRDPRSRRGTRTASRSSRPLGCVRSCAGSSSGSTRERPGARRAAASRRPRPSRGRAAPAGISRASGCRA